jgi:hypothetical protein
VGVLLPSDSLPTACGYDAAASYRSLRCAWQGHVFPSWCNGATGPDVAGGEGAYPQVCTACSRKHVGDSGWGPLRADLNTTYEFLESLFAEIAGVFPEQYIHLGT